MGLAPPRIGIVQCPECKTKFPVTLPSLGTTHSKRGGSGKIHSRKYFLQLYEVPYLNDIFNCPKCRHICKTKDLVEKNVKHSNYLQKRKESVNSAKRGPSRMEMLEKLLETKDFSLYREKELLILYWAGVTDPLEALWLNRDPAKGLKKYGGEQKPKRPINTKYLNRLLEILNSKDGKDRLLKIEVLRSLERFDEAKKLLDFDFKDEELTMVLRKEKENIERKNSATFLVKETPQIMY